MRTPRLREWSFARLARLAAAVLCASFAFPSAQEEGGLTLDGIAFVRCPGGTFAMGSNGGAPDESPEHPVRVGGFYMARHEVTFGQYDRFCEETGRAKPSSSGLIHGDWAKMGDPEIDLEFGWPRGDRPAINVSWHDAEAFCDWLSRETGRTVRLPTEAEWEYACRGGTRSRETWAVELAAWHSGNANYQTHAVMAKAPNALGLYDMLGNVWEWCADWYDPAEGRLRAVRGGSWVNEPRFCTATNRRGCDPSYKGGGLGFRVVVSLETGPPGAAGQAPRPSPPPPPPPLKVPPLAIQGTERMVDVGGRRLHAVVYGSGGPTVVLVSGFQAPQAYWNPLVEGIAGITTAVTYDRAGYGKSERGTLPVDGRQSVADLHALLGKLGVPKPYLLVGHSYGGRIVRLFASAYPGETAGLVLEETSHEDLPEAQLEALTGRDRETLAAMIAPYRTAVPDPVTETDYMSATVEQLRRSGPLPQVPLVVITSASRGSGLPPVFSPEGQAKLDEAAAAMQKKLVLLVPGAEQILVEGAGHNVHLDKPEAVLAPIRAMIARLRQGRGT